MASKLTSYHAQALTRGLEILRHLARSDGESESLSDLHDLTGLPKSTLVRLLTVLEHEGFVRRVDDLPNFRLSHAVVDLAEGYRRGTDVGVHATPYLKALADKTRQTANLGVIDGPSVVHLCVQEPDRSLRFRSQTGSRDALHCTALGKMLLAGFDDDVALDKLNLAPLDRRTDATLTAIEDVMADVARSRVRGFAVDNEEGDKGVYCIAVPIAPSPPKRPWSASISLSGPIGEMDEPFREQHLKALRETATTMSADAELTAALKVYRGPAG